jgi:hypothetical protein
VSLAAGFEIGRLLALSQPAIVNALMRWRQEQFGAQRAAHLAAEAAQPVGFLPPALFGNREPGLGALVGREMLLSAAQRSDAVFAPARPLVDPGRPLDYIDGDLDEVIATGLGLPLDQIRRNAKQIGLVGALAATSVKVAPQGDGGLDAGFDALRSNLDQFVDTVATEVLKQRPIVDREVEEAQPRRRRARPRRDALDDLLDALDESRDQ